MKEKVNIWKERVAQRIQEFKRVAEFGTEEDAIRLEGETSHYKRQFKKFAGESPFSLQRRLRLERGVYLLRKNGFRICDIAAECAHILVRLGEGKETIKSFTDK